MKDPLILACQIYPAPNMNILNTGLVENALGVIHLSHNDLSRITPSSTEAEIAWRFFDSLCCHSSYPILYSLLRQSVILLMVWCICSKQHVSYSFDLFRGSV